MRDEKPVGWQDTQVLNAAIGEYITIVRKDRYSDDWYLGSLTNEKPKTFMITLSFLEAGKQYQAQIYADADGITWMRDADRIAVSQKMVSAGDMLQLNLAPGGGTAIRFTA
jgi:alpha-glucosidase